MTFDLRDAQQCRKSVEEEVGVPDHTLDHFPVIGGR
jgi:hypothetical protein